VTGLVLVIAWVLLAYGSAAWQGFYNGLDIARVSVALLLLTAVLFGRRTLSGRLRWGALAVAFVAAAWGQVRYPAGYHASGGWLTASRALAVVATLLAATWLVVPLRGYRSRIWIPVTALMVVAGVCMIQASPHPEIDVWYVVDQAVARTLHLGNAYDMVFVGSPGDTDAYPYLPGSLILLAPFKLLFGDVRYGYLAAMALAAFFVRRTAQPAVGGALACLLLLYPRMLFGIEQVWTEPLLVAGLAATVYLTLSGHTRWAVVAFIAVLATKQHMFLLVPLAAWWPAFGLRRTAVSVAGAGAVCLPWFVTAPAGFWYGAGSYNFSLASRFDSMSIFTTLDNLGWKPPFLLVLVLSLGAIPLAMWRLPRNELGFVFGSAWVLFVFNWLNKQTFFNHYSLVLALLVIGLAARERSTPATEPAAERSYVEAVA
jgi:hypothetical protein